MKHDVSGRAWHDLPTMQHDVLYFTHISYFLFIVFDYASSVDIWITLFSDVANVSLSWTCSILMKVCLTVVTQRVAVGLSPPGFNTQTVHSCFTSDRINLSPFTKDFRGEEHYEYKVIFWCSADWRGFLCWSKTEKIMQL